MSATKEDGESKSCTTLSEPLKSPTSIKKRAREKAWHHATPFLKGQPYRKKSLTEVRFRRLVFTAEFFSEKSEETFFGRGFHEKTGKTQLPLG